MSYQPYNRSETRSSGIVFFGERGNADVLTSDSNFLLEDGAAGNIQAPNFKVADGGKIGSVSQADAITLAGNGNVTMSQSLSITGDLTVNGTTTTVNSTVTTIEDPVIILGSGAGAGYGGPTDDNKDRGIAFAWNNNGAANGQLGFFGHDDSLQRFVYYSSGTITNDVMGDVKLGDAEFRWGIFAGVSGNLVGDVTGTAADATILETTRTFSITGEGTATAQNFNGSQNVALPFVLDETAISNQTEKAGAAAAGDVLLILDSADSNNFKKITRSNLISGLGGFSSFTVSDRVTTGTVDDGEQVIFTDGPTINFTVAAEGSNHTVSGVVVDASIDENKLATSVAGDGLTGGGGSALAFDISDLATTDTDIAGTDLIAIHDGAQKKITFTNFVADIDHDALLNFVANEHIDHTSVDITAGNGLTGGGDISASRTLTVVGDSGILVTDKVHANLVDYTVQTTAANARTTDASRTYAIQVNSSDQLVVNVPWSDTTIPALTTEEVQDIVGDQLVTNGSHTLISAAYDDAGDGAIDLTVDNDLANYSNTNSAFITASSTDTLTNKTFDANGTGNSISNIEVADLAGSAVVTEGEGIASNDNDTTLPTSAAVKDYVDSNAASALKTVVTDSTTSAILATENVSLANANGGSITLTLPAHASGRQVTVKKTDATANTVTVTGATGNIDGAANVVLYSEDESVTVISDGANWHII